MPYRDDPDQADEEEARNGASEADRMRIRRVWHGFLDFAFSGNILEIAFGLM